MSTSRTAHSAKNLIFALTSQGFESILTFITRSVFIYALGETYLGMNGLFSDILTLLSLAELGFGTAIIYAMYKPTADGDTKKVASLLNLYRRIYCLLGLGMTVAGLLLTPFLHIFISDFPDLPELPVIYILYLLNTTLSYFFSYKKSILIANQVHHIVSAVTIVTTTLSNLIQMLVLITTHNFIAYLLVMLAATVLSNFAMSLYVDMKYPELRKYKKERLPKEDSKTILKNVGAMFFSKISSAVVTSTDNVLISSFVSTIILGYYSNYTLFVTIIRNIMLRINDAFRGSVGNLVASEDPKYAHKIFEKIFFFNFWIIAVFSILLFTFINPFITLWIGKEYLLALPVVFCICLNLYMRYIRNTQLIFIDTYGLFKEIRINCVAEASINLVASLILLIPLKMGISGVLLGTFISNICTNFWFEPYVIYRKRFGIPLRSYFGKFAVYFFTTFITGAVVYVTANILIPYDNALAFILKLIGAFIFINLVFFVLFRKTEEFRYFKNKIFKV